MHRKTNSVFKHALFLLHISGLLISMIFILWRVGWVFFCLCAFFYFFLSNLSSLVSSWNGIKREKAYKLKKTINLTLSLKVGNVQALLQSDDNHTILNVKGITKRNKKNQTCYYLFLPKRATLHTLWTDFSVYMLPFKLSNHTFM